jgi:hypothetical protein
MAYDVLYLKSEAILTAARMADDIFCLNSAAHLTVPTCGQVHSIPFVSVPSLALSRCFSAPACLPACLPASASCLDKQHHSAVSRHTDSERASERDRMEWNDRPSPSKKKTPNGKQRRPPLRGPRTPSSS